MDTQEGDLLLVAEVARQYEVSERTVERWIERGLDAQKATDEQLLQLLRSKRLKGLPPKGVWLIPRSNLIQLETIRRSVGYPKGKKRHQEA
ncbi:MAG TPA: hypothetical protein VEL31_03265 [Ktedonobacteraceae bacterium]|nr:hypothetical protein [Ktedonobacteraceae bacterium]